MKEIIVTVGASCSGKTSWAEKITRNREDWVNINRDDIRFALFCNGKRDWTKYKFTKKNERKVTEVCLNLAEEAGFDNKSIIISDTNLNPKTRQKWEEFAELGLYYSEKEFFCDWDTLVKRNNQREGGISQSILWEQYLRMNEYMGRKTYTPDTTKPKAFLCDIDGTIADMAGKRSPFQWNKVSGDIPRKIIISMVEGLLEEGVTPIFLSGRDGVCTEDTYTWIKEHLMQYHLPDKGGFHLYQRSAGDDRKDTVIKEELFWKYIADHWNVVASFDDRPCMVRLWHELKIPNVIAVADPFKEF